MGPGPAARRSDGICTVGRTVFISYARADSPTVNHIVRSLQRAGHEVWLDRDDIEGGASWGERIVEAIDACDVLVMALSPRSVASAEVAREVHLARARRRPIIPLMLAPARLRGQLEYDLAGIHRIDLSQNVDGGIRRLLSDLDQPLSKPRPVHGRHRTAGVVVGPLAVAVLVVAAGSFLTGGFPPQVDAATGNRTCETVQATVVDARPESTPFRSGAAITLDFHNAGSDIASIPAAGGATVVGEGGRQYDVERLPGLGDWFRGFEVDPGSTRQRTLGAEGRNNSDTVDITVPGIDQGRSVLDRCRIEVVGVDVDFADG